MSEAILSVNNVTLSFEGVTALSDVTFDVRSAEICSLIGPNGAGKSSLLNVISGLYRPNTGTVRLLGETAAFVDPLRAARRGSARTFQNIALFKKMSVLDNLLVGRTPKWKATAFESAFRIGRYRRDAQIQTGTALTVSQLLGLTQYNHVEVGRLPYGLQKRVELGRALASEPQLLLLDEPLAGMNFDEKAELARLIVGINQRLGTTVLLIEHDMGVVMDISKHIVVLDYGRKIAEGDPETVRRDARVVEAYLGSTHGST